MASPLVTKLIAQGASQKTISATKRLEKHGK